MSFPERLYHATPLHYLLMILQERALYAQQVAIQRGISPRVTAKRRDKMLGLDLYVHLSPHSKTPLLADKLKKGYPHALLVFSASEVMDLPECALLCYNPKSWQSRSSFQPISDRSAWPDIWNQHRTMKQFPSLAVLVKYGLPLDALQEIALCTDAERNLIQETMDAVPSLAGIAEPIANPGLFPMCDGYFPRTADAVAAYLKRCREHGTVLPPPAIPFD